MRNASLLFGIALLCCSAAAADVQFAVDTQQDVRPISRFVYGTNGALEGGYSNAALTRLGGNRWTAYNWENNASNAGTDYFNQNDSYLSNSDTPGAAVRDSIVAAQAHGAAILLTVPTNGYVAADKNGGGDVNQTPNYLQVRFEESRPSKGAPFSLMPNASDGFVYQDEFVNWVDHEFPGSAGSAHPIFYSLDNEPDLWPGTHPRIHPNPTTYAELVAKSIAYATAIKNVNPAALVFGPVNYGWYGYVLLQGAPDAAGRDFQQFWLAEIEAAQQLFGARLVDVLDVHWYPEAQGGGVRITGTETTPAVVAARLQAPRSLWDSSYTETSWIAQDSVGGPIALLPRLRDKIDANAPGTKLAVTEYNYGAGQHISGGIAQADVLGIFGREGVFAASEWPLAGDESYIEGAFEMYRNFDGSNGHFGDTSVRAGTDDIAKTSIYASLDSVDATRMVLVVLNKTALPQGASLDIASPASYVAAKVYQLSAGVASPVSAVDLSPTSANHFLYTMPAYSVSTLVLTAPEPGTESVAIAAGAALLLLGRARARHVRGCGGSTRSRGGTHHSDPQVSRGPDEERGRRTSPMRIVLAAEGTRGDLQPMIELGLRLSNAGHDVVLGGPPDFTEQAASRGVRFVPCGTSFRKFLAEHADAVDGHPARALREGFRYLRERFETRLATLLDLTRGADLVVGAGAEMAASTAAGANGVAYRYVAYCPAMFPSREHGPIFTPWQGLPGWLNRALWPLVMRPLTWSVRGAVAPARRRLGLDPRTDMFTLLFGSRPLLAVDPSLAGVPSDATLPIDQVASFHPLEGEPLPDKLESFLESGPPPVYLGFGSMPDTKPAATTRALVDAITRVGCRAVISAGWAELGDGPLPEGVIAIGAVSHPSLFARCAVIVHHGGAGTTTTAARAGVPQIVVPHIADQFYWSRRVLQLGIAAPGIPRRRLDATRLVAALETILDNEIVAERARELGARLRAEAAASDPVRALLG